MSLVFQSRASVIIEGDIQSSLSNSDTDTWRKRLFFRWGRFLRQFFRFTPILFRFFHVLRILVVLEIFIRFSSVRNLWVAFFVETWGLFQFDVTIRYFWILWDYLIFHESFMGLFSNCFDIWVFRGLLDNIAHSFLVVIIKWW